MALIIVCPGYGGI